jgi:hypothetical protein
MVGRTKFSCIYCGAPYEAYPPDSIHDMASLKPEDVGDPQKMIYKCQNKDCGKENIIYWGYQEVYGGVEG